MIYLVVGPPCGGKSHHVDEHAATRDLVIDWDDIARDLVPSGSPASTPSWWCASHRATYSSSEHSTDRTHASPSGRSTAGSRTPWPEKIQPAGQDCGGISRRLYPPETSIFGVGAYCFGALLSRGWAKLADCLHCGTTMTGRRRVCDECKAKMPTPKPRRPRRDADADATPKTTRSKPRRPRGAAAAAPAPAPEGPADPVPAPTGLHPRGLALWTELGQRQGTAPGELALEVCRMVDRLNELDRIIAGKGVMQLMQFRLELDLTIDDTRNINVKVGFQEVLKEARLQQSALKDLLKELRAAIAAADANPAPQAPETPSVNPATAPALSPLDQLALRRAEREQATAGT